MLYPDHRVKIDPSDDAEFYRFPRFVTHVDDGFIQQLTELYREQLHLDMKILDLMSSWVSHLPDDMSFAHVEGHGLSREELARNPRLDHYFVQDLNQQPKLPFPDQSFDAVLNAVSVQYLQYPEAIFAEIYRILKPGGVSIVSFSNRMFFQKAIQIWRDSSEPERLELVKRYFQAINGFEAIQTISRSSPMGNLFQMLGLSNGDPFYAVMARRDAIVS
ncbi:MAG: class I SAM-dependent methyltransferase [Thermosynechococcaceae cyanobacterium]